MSCEHGKCTQKPDVCECEANWGPPGKCNTYEGPCLNCSSDGGSCKNGPHTCECKPGLTFLIVLNEGLSRHTPYYIMYRSLNSQLGSIV